MKKTYIFSDKINTDFLKDIPGLSEKLTVVPFEGLTAEQALEKDFDSILLGEGDFQAFKNLLKALNWKTSHLEVADTLVKNHGGYLPMNLNADCILQTLLHRQVKLDTSQSLMVIGTYDFVLSVVAKMALTGYSKFYISLYGPDRFSEMAKHVNEFVFNLKLNHIQLNELTRVQTASGLMIANLTQEMDPEAFEAMTYFNFLSHGATFVDFQSYKNDTLIEEAKRAELQVVEELEILTLKFHSLI
jgi:hypothetical protein